MGRLLVLMLAATALASGAAPQGRLAEINAALRAWLDAVDADRPYLLLDRGAEELQLRHGQAVLRVCPVLADSAAARAGPQVKLEHRLRWYRPSRPGSSISAGPFDWEQNLAEQASGGEALYFGGGLLLYAASGWGRPGVPSLRLGDADLRALYETCPVGAQLVVLPPGWREGDEDEQP